MGRGSLGGKGGRAVIFLLRVVRSAFRLRRRGGACGARQLDAAERCDLLLEEVSVGRRFHVRRGLSILASRNQEEKSAGRAEKGR
ncbi:MAG: hypothetical protein AB2556_23955 [Candidatus Thiodiazotropha sp.]